MMSQTRALGTFSIETRLLCIAILFTPLLSIFEILSLFGGDAVDQSRVGTPILIKLIKDLIILLIAIRGMQLLLRRGNILKSHVIFGTVFIAIFLISIFISFHVDNLVILSGVRFFFPLVLLFLCEELDVDVGIVSNCMILIFIFHLITQLIQYYYPISHFGIDTFGFSARSPGIFLIPNTAAAFTCLALVLVLQSKRTRAVCLLGWALAGLSLILAGSGTGFLALSLLGFLELTKCYRWGMRAGLTFIFVTLTSILLISTDFRGERYLEDSVLMRYKILSDSVFEAAPISDTFGLGTTSARLLGYETIATDSLWASFATNLGLIPLFSYVIFVIFFFFSALRRRLQGLLLIFAIIIPFSLASNVLDVWPLNLLAPIFLVARSFYKVPSPG